MKGKLKLFRKHDPLIKEHVSLPFVAVIIVGPVQTVEQLDTVMAFVENTWKPLALAADHSYLLYYDAPHYARFWAAAETEAQRDELLLHVTRELSIEIEHL